MTIDPTIYVNGRPLLINLQPVHHDWAGRISSVGSDPVHHDWAGRISSVGSDPVHRNWSGEISSGGEPVYRNLGGHVISYRLFKVLNDPLMTTMLEGWPDS